MRLFLQLCLFGLSQLIQKIQGIIVKPDRWVLWRCLWCEGLNVWLHCERNQLVEKPSLCRGGVGLYLLFLETEWCLLLPVSVSSLHLSYCQFYSFHLKQTQAAVLIKNQKQVTTRRKNHQNLLLTFQKFPHIFKQKYLRNVKVELTVSWLLKVWFVLKPSISWAEKFSVLRSFDSKTEPWMSELSVLSAVVFTDHLNTLSSDLKLRSLICSLLQWSVSSLWSTNELLITLIISMITRTSYPKTDKQ